MEICECSQWRRLGITFSLDFCIFIVVQRLPLFPLSLWSGIYSSFLPIPRLCLSVLVLRGWSAAGLLSKGFFWPGSSWVSHSQQRACSGFWQDYECLLSSNHSYHKTQIKMDRYIFNEFTNLKGFVFLLKQASGFPSCALASLGYFTITACSFPWLTAQTFCMVLEIISNEEWDLAVIFRSEVACFYRTDYLAQFNL